ncbi:hypothetical protein KIH87_17180 [Paraneptunicella aestuarii]|uniref:choice-of-anchor X domain-containing protein n=1 Tax=Paraneptunicella aestuarii TaxID=2831148 RepID=UPI001E2B6C9B|nr:choice-of-anchor X domain-containing protein [Paraneptunicella aestuarii]UAA38396.1 hypothetical protein KIH87_17180 [Paraneptunicella aestuarii]
MSYKKVCASITAGALLLTTAVTFASGTGDNPVAQNAVIERVAPNMVRLQVEFEGHVGGTLTINHQAGGTILFDDGSNGDNNPDDGVFSAIVEFDVGSWIANNQRLADTVTVNPVPIFHPTGRNIIGYQSYTLQGEQIIVSQNMKTGEQRSFSLPLLESAFPVGAPPMPIPVNGPLWLPAPEFVNNGGGSIQSIASIGLAATPPPSGFWPKSLLIQAPPVLQDPGRTWSCSNGPGGPSAGNPRGNWTFWKLMENMVGLAVPNDAATSNFIRNIFSHYNAPQVINGHVVNPRPPVFNQVIANWEAMSGVGPGGVLKPKFSPFELMAIVLRPDLASQSGATGYGGGSAGEGRFVFGLHDGNCNQTPPLTVILEYDVPLVPQSCTSTQNWVTQWFNLQFLTGASYNNQLDALTQVFSGLHAALSLNPRATNGSAINQVRTNDFFLGPWEMREFVLPANMGGSGFNLFETDVKQEPDISYNLGGANNFVLDDYMNVNWPAITGGTHIVPLNYTLSISPFTNHNMRGASAPAPQVWDAVPTSAVPATPSTFSAGTVLDDTKFLFAVNTCSGCHTTETATPFVHIDPNNPGPGAGPAALSGFLTGINNVPDARGAAVPPLFWDFADLTRREQVMNNMMAMSCTNPNAILQAIQTAPPIAVGHH